MMLRNTQLATFLLRSLSIATLGLTLLAPAAYAADPVTLTLYNGQHKEVGDNLAAVLEAKTGIHVNVRKGSSNQLASQIMEEGDRSPADVFYAEESPPLNSLGEQGFLAKADDSLKENQTITFDKIKNPISTILACEGELAERSQQWIQAAKSGVFTGQSDVIPAYDPDYHFDSPAIWHDTRLLHFCAAAAHHRYLILETLLPAQGISVLRP